ncbi:MAG TPA: Nif3-like dinuclear metal center hexameric protein [Thermoclostridium sp.]|nr:Nif3-like dinuclear metal center hexameric protein [Thermoclostridium sp.]
MKCKDVIHLIEQQAPLFLQESYDNSGLQWGNPENAVQRVLVCLDFTQDVLKCAIDNEVQLVISHHPILFTPLKSINTGIGKGAMLFECIQNNITVYASHTNFDVANNGLNEFLAKTFELQNITGLKRYYSHWTKKFVETEYSLGRVGSLKEKLNAEKFLDFVKQRLNAPNIRVIGKTENVDIENVAVFCGSFDGDIKALREKNIDALITGDIKYHIAQELEQTGILTVDAGHYHTEKVFIKVISDMLKSNYKDVIIIEHYGNDIFSYR